MHPLDRTVFGPRRLTCTLGGLFTGLLLSLGYGPEWFEASWLAFGVLGAIAGFVVGSLRSAVSDWSVILAVAGGLIGFVAGAFIYTEGSLAILGAVFRSGPLGVVAGALLGLIVGVLIVMRRTTGSHT